jgi:hypothetical protein
MDINYASIEMADNGYVVCWSEKQTPKSPMDHCEYVDHKQVFTEKQEDKAWDFYKEKKMASLYCAQKNKSSY